MNSPIEVNMDDAKQADSSAREGVDGLFQTVYHELRESAHRMRRSQRGDTLNTTQLVHELYLRMRKSDAANFAVKAQFFAYAGRAMRSIMVDHARSKLAARHQSAHAEQAEETPLEPAMLSPESALLLDSALDRLAVEDARAAKVVELHFFAGLTIADIATQLDLAPRTVDRDWQFARAFLQSQLGVLPTG
jgi:RNA polymerase sigma factor (TIGR02999 family)